MECKLSPKNKLVAVAFVVVSRSLGAECPRLHMLRGDSTLGACLMKKIRSGCFLGHRDRAWANLCPRAAIQMYRSLHIHLVSTTHSSHIQALLSSCHHQTTACCGLVGQLEEKGVVPRKVITDAPKPSSVLSRGSLLATSART